MRLNINKNKNGISKSGKPSRFLVELKSQIEELSENELRGNIPVKKTGLSLFFGNIITLFKKQKKAKTEVFFVDDKKKEYFSRTLFFPILNIVYKIFKSVFWIFLFFIRFFYFSFEKIAKLGKKRLAKEVNIKAIIDNDRGGGLGNVPQNRILGSIEFNEKKKSFFNFKLKKEKPRFSFSISYFKKAVYFLLILVIVSLPFKFAESFSKFDISAKKGMVLGASEEAAFNLINASKSVSSFDLTGAQGNFVKAGDDLLGLKIELEKINNGLFFLASFIPNQKVRLASEGKKIVEAGIIGTEIGDNFSTAISAFSDKEEKLTESLTQFNYSLGELEKNIIKLEKLLDSINLKVIPKEYLENALLVKESISSMKPLLSELIDLTDKLIVFLGAYEDKRYLFIFQNNTELRASGGFIGSYAQVDFSSGEIKNIDVPGGGSYDTEAGLREFIIAPEPLHLIKPMWYFWDANWWPDFKKTAKKLMWFYEKSDGPSVDGVISMTPSVLEKVLKIIGPIDMSEDYGLVINSDNFWIETQNLAEQKPDVTKKPKKIIGDLMDKIIEELPKRINAENIFEFSEVILESLNEKHVLFYFEDKELQNKVREYSWSGEIEESLYDYLMVVNTNIAGGKSDRDVVQKITHKSVVGEEGDIYNTVIVEREHKGKKGDMFSGVRNNSWMRFYVPEGSELIEASGFNAMDVGLFKKTEDFWEVDQDLVTEREAIVDLDSGTKSYNESGKTVFANWSWIDPGEKTTVVIKYKLPFKIEYNKIPDKSFLDRLNILFKGDRASLTPYSLMIQKQAGTKNDAISTSLVLPNKSKIVWSYGANIGKDSGWNLKGFLDKDKYWAVLIEN